MDKIHTDDDFHTLQDITYHRFPMGSVQDRIDSVPEMENTVTQRFDYDSNEMISSWTFISENDGSWSTSYQPKADGTIQGMFGIGSGAQGLRFTYGSTNQTGGPHAVTAVNGTASHYDGAGNRIDDLAQKTIAYTSFGLPKQVQSGVEAANFLYDADRVRAAKTWNAEGTVESQTLYVGGLYEQRIDGSGVKTHVFYITGPDRIVAQETWRQDASGIQPQATLWFHPDTLGSIDAISRRDGQPNVRAWYDPFGRRISTSDPTFGSAPDPSVTLGFTGHEMDDDMGYINMKGRIYDPSTGRFLTPDPFKQFPFESAGYDRYAYTENRPLKFVDPTGFTYTSGLNGEILGGGDSMPIGTEHPELGIWNMDIPWSAESGGGDSSVSGADPGSSSRSSGIGAGGGGKANKTAQPPTPTPHRHKHHHKSHGHKAPKPVNPGAATGIYGARADGLQPGDELITPTVTDLPMPPKVPDDRGPPSLLPDALNVNVTVPVIGFLGVSMTGSLDRNGDVHFGAGPAAGAPDFSGSISGSFITPNTPVGKKGITDDQINDHMNGTAISFSFGSFIVPGLPAGGGYTKSNSGHSVEVGLYTPQVGVAHTVTGTFFHTKAKW